ncbi:MAG TPA: hypothetical protein VHG70_12705 [Nocardioidaceae bacterium]|nr:hypothetical protein [Nocardioidaceae bacterium]
MSVVTQSATTPATPAASDAARRIDVGVLEHRRGDLVGRAMLTVLHASAGADAYLLGPLPHKPMR